MNLKRFSKNTQKQLSLSRRNETKFSTNRKYFLGFTLVELLVVITILGILSSIGIGNFLTSQIKGRDAQRKSDLKQLQTALELYNGDNNRYPTADSSSRIIACPSLPNPFSCEWGEGPITDGKTVYSQSVPDDPVAGKYFYVYKVSNDGSKYQVFTFLENKNDPDLVSNINVSCGEENCNFGLTSPNTNLKESI